jgi:hypothetical protein
MPEITPKKMGCCSLCDALLFEVERRWTDGPMEGEVREFGKPLDGVKRSTVVLQSGVRADFSLCARCELTPENLSLVWRRGLLAMAKEISVEWRTKQAKARGRGLNYTPEHQAACQKMLEDMQKDPPVGVLFTQTWAEIADG